jgi:hypothetical protein
MTNTKETLTIASLERLRLSSNGNPRFRVTFTDGRQADTQTDASVNYGLENRQYQGVPIEVTFSPNGRIVAVKAVSS